MPKLTTYVTLDDIFVIGIIRVRGTGFSKGFRVFKGVRYFREVSEGSDSMSVQHRTLARRSARAKSTKSKEQKQLFSIG